MGTVICRRFLPNADVTLGGWVPSAGASGYDLLADNAPANIFTVTGQLTPDAANNIRINNTYYRPTAGSVDAGAPAGTSANPWLVAMGVDAATSLANLFNAINATGVAGTTYSTALTAHPNVSGKGVSATQFIITSNDGVTTAYTCTETMANASWAAAPCRLLGRKTCPICRPTTRRPHRCNLHCKICPPTSPAFGRLFRSCAREKSTAGWQCANVAYLEWGFCQRRRPADYNGVHLLFRRQRIEPRYRQSVDAGRIRRRDGSNQPDALIWRLLRPSMRRSLTPWRLSIIPAPRKIRTSQFDALTIFNFSSERVEASQYDAVLMIERQGVTATMEVSQFDCVAILRGAVDDPKVRAWTFTLDGHEFYVLKLGNIETLIYDVYAEQWYIWGTGDGNRWRAFTGHNWLGGRRHAEEYGSNILVGDESNGALYFLNPLEITDDDPVSGADVQRPFLREIMGKSRRGAMTPSPAMA